MPVKLSKRPWILLQRLTDLATSFDQPDLSQFGGTVQHRIAVSTLERCIYSGVPEPPDHTLIYTSVPGIVEESHCF